MNVAVAAAAAATRARNLRPEQKRKYNKTDYTNK